MTDVCTVRLQICITFNAVFERKRGKNYFFKEYFKEVNLLSL